jgi:hypothetical protein
MVRVTRKILGQEIGVVEDEEEKRWAFESGLAVVLYTRDEVERMRGLQPEDIRAIHSLKRKFGGSYEGPSDTTWPKREVPITVSLFDIAEAPPPPSVFPGGWGDDVITPQGAGTVVSVWDNDHDKSHVTVQLDAGGKVTFKAMEVQLCATAA